MERKSLCISIKLKRWKHQNMQKRSTRYLTLSYIEYNKASFKILQGSIISRLFKKKDKKTDKNKIDECNSEESDDSMDSQDRERGLTISHSLPNIASVGEKIIK